MRVIKLCSGSGNGIDQACLMTASNMLIGRGEDGDQNSCVCPLLRSFIIATNDVMPGDVRQELYGPLVWEILGTRNNDIEIMQKRAFAFADWAVRDVCGIDCVPIVNKQTAADAADAAESAFYAAAAAAESAFYAAADAARAAAAAYAAAAAESAFYAAAAAAESAFYAAAAARAAARAAAIWRKCPEIIRRVAAIGDKRPVETVMTMDELAEQLA